MRNDIYPLLVFLHMSMILLVFVFLNIVIYNEINVFGLIGATGIVLFLSFGIALSAYEHGWD